MEIKEKVLKECLSDWKKSFGNGTSEHCFKKAIDLTLAEAEKEFIRRTKKGICLICKKKDKFAKECVCGACWLKWAEKKGKLKEYIKKAEVSKVINDNFNRCDMTGGAKCEYDKDEEPIVKEVLAINIEDWNKLKQKLGIK